MKTAVITDSTAYLPRDVRRANHIHMVPLNVIFGHESYQEEVDISADDFYDMVKEGRELPKTSQPSIGIMTEKLEELAREYDSVVSIHLSSGISGTYQAMVTAGEMVEEIDVRVFDSEISCHMQGFYALEAAELAKNGATPDEIISRLNEMKQSMNAYFMVDDLSHLQRGGRLNGAQAFVGSLLQVKPVLHFVDTKIVPFEKIRTRKKAIKKILSLLEEEVEEDGTYKACLIHANRLEEAEELKKELEQKHSNVEVVLSYFGPVIGTHLGEGAMGLGWYRQS
ncbi:EDD domain protein, DegV family [Halobacillus karajensis]|uniref:DegV domain-containing protein n=1 Tax=Halobacillus karajensis TaxID=195088 RepID=A0A059NWJ0_9BACI|nr:DegV family protein [Halobacillus karajensis]CDQ19202.1 DegV domain-containing protein [Halobacillus karajensis]CDQ22724.1 DegV domain-containing protein [Halobacillus karajensis]CDQ26206.1 DegV domain-containing protein [Halobacillus karajensis]SEH40143.1 EDD domain protein, DegV family [Halobacillus karajensis]